MEGQVIQRVVYSSFQCLERELLGLESLGFGGGERGNERIGGWK